jgi:hypothetical protein
MAHRRLRILVRMLFRILNAQLSAAPARQRVPGDVSFVQLRLWQLIVRCLPLPLWLVVGMRASVADYHHAREQRSKSHYVV